MVTGDGREGQGSCDI